MNQYSPSINKNVPKIVPHIRAAHFHKPSAQHRLSGLFLQRSVVDALKKIAQKNNFCPNILLDKILLKTKVIIDKSRGEVSLVEQDIIDYVSTAYFDPRKNSNSIFFFLLTIVVC